MKTHPLDVSSMVFGLVFLGVVTGWTLYEVDVVSGEAMMWYLPIVLIAAGVVGIALSATKGRRSKRRAVTSPPSTSADESTRTLEQTDD